VFFRFLWLAITAASAFALYCLVTMPSFQIHQVDVHGTQNLSPAAVKTAADLVGKSAFAVSSRTAMRQVEGLGVPLHVSVSFSLPNAAIVSVVERSPAFIWKVDPTMFLVSEDGTVLGPTTEESQRVIVVDSDRQPVAVGQKVDASVLREAAYVERVLPLTGSFSPHYLLYTRDLGVVIPTPTGIQIALGGDEDLAAKLENLQPTLYVASVQKPLPSLVDLRFPLHPYFR
jgi:cell division septal protein FtsQ